MRYNKSLFALLSIPVLLTGCWGVTLEPDTPREYIKKKTSIESLYGSTAEDIIGHLGQPKWIEHRNDSTYFIYEWRRTDKDLVFFVIPIPIAGGRVNFKWYCIMLEFDKDNRLIHYESADDSYRVPAWAPFDSYEKQINCLNIFKIKLITDRRPGRIIDKSESTSEENMTTFSYLIAMSNNEHVRVESKFSGFSVGECVNVLFGKLDIRIAPGDGCPTRLP
jgi:hypothetical protein